MWKIEKGNIYVTRGDMLPLAIDALNADKSQYKFKTGEVLRIKVMEKENVSNIVLERDFVVEEDTQVVNVDLLSEDTRIGELINKPHEYWYEVELNPDTPETMTIVGYSKEKGAALFVLLPEGGKKNDTSKITN